MEVKDVKAIERKLKAFLSQFDDCLRSLNKRSP